MLDIEFIRSQFPAFSQPGLRDQAFFENAGGSYTSKYVIDRLTRFYKERKVQPYSAYDASRLGGEEMDEARARMAALMGVDTGDVSFGPSTTQNTYVLAQAFGEWMSEGEAIVVTNQDHEANTGPWRRLADRGIEVREWRMDPDTGHLDPADLEGLLDEKVRLVCFTHCSNVVGEINDVSAICAMAHLAGAFTCVDGVSYAPHGIPNVGQMGPDIYLFSAYKTYGPHQGVMVIRPNLAQFLPNQGHFFNGDAGYKRFTPAGPDHAQIAACAGMPDYTDAVYAHHFDEDADPTAQGEVVARLMRAQEIALSAPLLDYLKGRNDLRLIGPTNVEARAPTIAICHETPGAMLAEDLVPHGINCGGGSFYAVRALDGLGIDPNHGVLRISLAHYNTQAEVDRLISALDQVL